jgi:hypothetical protein
MNEGEFKKRNKALVIQSRLYHWKEIHKIQSLFDSWTDEAKKEFPKFKKWNKNTKDDWMNLALLRYTWFVKWFGEAEKHP